MSDQSIVKEKIEYLHDRLGMPLQAFTASDEELLWINGDRFNKVAINNLVSHIMIHLKAPFVKFTINLYFVDESTQPGTYSVNGGPTINLRLAHDYTTEQIIAVVCHECTHHFLFSKGIRLEDVHENEVLTDIAAIYLGFGNYIAAGYQTVQKQVGYTFNGRIIRTSKIGYISEHQIQIAMNEVNKLVTEQKSFSESINQKIQDYKQGKTEKALKELESLKELGKKDCEVLAMLSSTNEELVKQICFAKNAKFSNKEYVVF